MPRPKIAAINTEYRLHSHAQHIVDRFIEGYCWQGQHHRPDVELVAMYVDQIGDNDLSGDRVERHAQIKRYPTIEEALTLGGSKLAVDGVLLIGEHGTYEKNEKGQVLYPRWEFFEKITDVYRSSGRTAPIFNDKHLSWSWDLSKKMYDISRELGFAFMAGSSLPVTWRLPAVDMPWGAKVPRAVCIGYGGVDSYDFHAIETLQCMVERRQGGECGVEFLETYRGDAFWEAQDNQVWPRALFEAALMRSQNIKTPPSGASTILPTLAEIKAGVKDPIAYHYRHRDGLECTMILLNGMVQDFNFAAEIEGGTSYLSTQFYLQMPWGGSTLASFFNPLSHYIERMFVTGRASYPLERTLLTSGLTAAAVDSIYEKGRRIETPQLDVAYEVGPESFFQRS